MAAPEPRVKNLADLYDLAPLDWADVRRTLETNLTQEPGTGGPGHHTFWLSTIDADGRPHMTAVGAFWVDGRYDQRGRMDGPAEIASGTAPEWFGSAWPQRRLRSSGCGWRP